MTGHAQSVARFLAGCVLGFPTPTPLADSTGQKMITFHKYLFRPSVHQQKHGLDDGWWARQPRVTAKSGWVTYGAARTVDGRVHALLATNCLGIGIVEDCWRSLAAQGKHDRAQHH